MRVTKDGVFFDNWEASDTSAPNGKIHFLDDMRAEVNLNPGILAMLIGISAHQFKIASPEIDFLVKQLKELGKEYEERKSFDHLLKAWEVSTEQERTSLVLQHIGKLDSASLRMIQNACKHKLESKE